MPAATPPPVLGSATGSGVLPGARPVLPGPPVSTSYRGPLTAGTLYSAAAPAGRWVLSGSSGVASPSPAFGWAGRYRVTQGGTATLRFDGGPTVVLSFLYSLVAWLVAVALVVGAGTGRIRSERSWRRRRPPAVTEPEGPMGPEELMGEWDAMEPDRP